MSGVNILEQIYGSNLLNREISVVNAVMLVVEKVVLRLLSLGQVWFRVRRLHGLKNSISKRQDHTF